MSAASRSRNVNRYVRAVVRARELTCQLEDALAARIAAERALTGAQWAEARRILADQTLVNAVYGVRVAVRQRPRRAS